MKKMYKRNICPVLYGVIIFFSSCHTAHLINTSGTQQNIYHSFYDDSSLSLNNNPVLLPYNRFLNPAGAIVKFGDNELENHSLDCITIPGENVMVTEDRYGLTFINVINKKVIYHLTYQSNLTDENFMSTYSGLKVAEINNKKCIFWSAANP